MKLAAPAFSRTDIIVLLTAFIVLFVPVFFIEYRVLQYTGGVFMYPLDDTFIHLEIARHVADEGTWGVNNKEFGSASSSLLYTIILSLFSLFTKSTVVPFIVNCIAGALLVWQAQRWLAAQGLTTTAQVVVLLLAILLTPLATLIVSGMEHTLQALLVFMFVFRFSAWMEASALNSSRGLPFSVLLYGVLVALIRYEGLFVIATAALILLFHRRIKAGFVLGAVALLPVVLFGIYSLSKGSYFLPNSVLVKSDTPSSGLLSFFSNILVEKLTYARMGLSALATQRWLVILPVLYLVFRKQMRLSYSLVLLFLITITLLQLALAATGWLYRYEAYLFFSAVIITGVLIYRYGRDRIAVRSWLPRIVLGFFVFFLIFPVLLRGLSALSKTKQACINIYEQQYQMARFSHQYYNNTPIAANDIGAIAYFTNAPIVDLWGLGTFEVAKSKKEKYWSPAFLDSFSRKNNVPFAMAYDIWFNDSLQNRWYKVASWQIQNNVICGDDEVSFYALDSTYVPVLKTQLSQFQPKLPPTVTVQYFR